MTKWEYQGVKVRSTYDWHGNATQGVAFDIETADEEIRLPPDEARVIIELNQLGRESWEVISINCDRLPDGVKIEYFLKRPITEQMIWQWPIKKQREVDSLTHLY